MVRTMVIKCPKCGARHYRTIVEKIIEYEFENGRMVGQYQQTGFSPITTHECLKCGKEWSE